jgi:hypothetical protein
MVRKDNNAWDKFRMRIWLKCKMLAICDVIEGEIFETVNPININVYLYIKPSVIPSGHGFSGATKMKRQTRNVTLNPNQF